MRFTHSPQSRSNLSELCSGNGSVQWAVGPGSAVSRLQSRSSAGRTLLLLLLLPSEAVVSLSLSLSVYLARYLRPPGRDYYVYPAPFILLLLLHHLLLLLLLLHALLLNEDEV